MLWESNRGLGLEQEPTSAATYIDWRERSTTLESIAAYRYRGVPYRVVMNGQTGKLQGSAPVSALKVIAAIGLGLLAGAVVIMFVATV